MVLGWAATLPLVGFSIFGILTFLPLFGILLGPKMLLGFIYGAGGVPAFVTAAGFEFRFVHWGLARSLIATTALGIAASIGWGMAVLYFLDLRSPLGSGYVVLALALAAAFPAALMPMTRFAKDRRRWA
jgi:hypothetical protein